MPGPVAVDYSRLASTYDRVRSSPREVQEFWLPALTRLADVPEGSLVLDVGCGTGRISVPLSERHRVVGVDASREMLGVARSKGGPARFLLGDAARLPFPGGRFRVALAVLVLHLLPDFRSAVGEMSRVAARAIVATVDIHRRETHAIDKAFPSLQGIDASRFPRIPAIEQAFRAAGCRSVERHDATRRVEASTEEFLDRVRGKYLSTLSLLPPGEFERGLAWLEEELPRRGPRYTYSHTVTFVVAST